jgi:hypothetical protein
MEEEDMTRPTKTRSERWDVKGDPAKWVHKPGRDWRSQREGEADLQKIGPWVEDMEEWSEMMYEAVMELREEQAALRHEFTELSELMKSGRQPGGDR